LKERKDGDEASHLLIPQSLECSQSILHERARARIRRAQFGALANAATGAPAAPVL
jgi:hypothetical protein